MLFEKSQVPSVTSEKLRASGYFCAATAFVGAATLGLLIGPADIDKASVILELIIRVPFVEIDSGLSDIHKKIIWEVRFPRVLLGGLVGATLAISGLFLISLSLNNETSVSKRFSILI